RINLTVLFINRNVVSSFRKNLHFDCDASSLKFFKKSLCLPHWNPLVLSAVQQKNRSLNLVYIIYGRPSSKSFSGSTRLLSDVNVDAAHGGRIPAKKNRRLLPRVRQLPTFGLLSPPCLPQWPLYCSRRVPPYLA